MLSQVKATDLIRCRLVAAQRCARIEWPAGCAVQGHQYRTNDPGAPLEHTSKVVHDLASRCWQSAKPAWGGFKFILQFPHHHCRDPSHPHGQNEAATQPRWPAHALSTAESQPSSLKAGSTTQLLLARPNVATEPGHTGDSTERSARRAKSIRIPWQICSACQNPFPDVVLLQLSCGAAR